MNPAYNSGTNNLVSPKPGDWGFTAFMHEIGHALGLEHAGDYNGGSPSYLTDALYQQDTLMYAIMSYFDAEETGADRITGNDLANRLVGNGGNDVLDGGLGNDQLAGSTGNDALYGGTGNDHLWGGFGNDVLNGGSGNDLFIFNQASFGADRIADFEDGLDRLRFWSVVADSLADFAISGNGTAQVTLWLGGQSLILQGTAAITLTAADFMFF